MEHCPYGSVGSLVKEGHRLNEEALRDVASCCLLGMDYLQRKKLECVGSVSSSECVVDQTG